MGDVTIFAGDSQRLEVEVFDPDGELVDLLGVQAITWHLSRTVHHRPAIVEKSIGQGVTVVDAPNGRVDIEIDPADTEGRSGRHYHEIEVIDEQGHVSTILTGTVTIRPTNIPMVT